MPSLLDITTLATVEDLNSVDFPKFSDGSWVKRLKYPVAWDDLTRVVLLSQHLDCKWDLAWDMGELFYRKKPCRKE